MVRWEQFEVWAMTKGEWQQVGHFNDLDLASAVFRNRTYRQKLIHAVYEGEELISSDVLAEIGRTRETREEETNGHVKRKPARAILDGLLKGKLKVKLPK